MPKVSVIMPCYNHEKYVGQAINSVLSQTYTDFEFLIVDNGCTDNSYDVISSFKDSRMRIFRLEKNDVIGAIKLLLNNTTGEYIATMYSDDMWEKEKLQKQMNVLENNDDILLCAAWAVYADENMNIIEGNNIFKMKNRRRLEWIRYLLENGNCLSMCSVVARQDIYKKYLMKQAGFWQLPDYNAWLLALQETNIYMVEEVLVRLRFHGDEKNKNISFPDKENHIRTVTEQAYILRQTMENLSDEDFLEIYREELVYPQANTHLEVLCEKFFVLLKFAERQVYFQDNVLYFFYKYFSYEENGVSVGEILQSRYNYTQIDFRTVSGSMGMVAEINRRSEYEAILLKKLRGLLPEDIRKKLKQIYDELQVNIEYIANGDVSSNVLISVISDMEGMLEIWNVLEYMEVPASREEIELCIRLCKIYVDNINIVDNNALCNNLLHLQGIINEILV